ncbi:UDP-4-amino-4,6-dideoxy-N-acetyl-beta-L-altrosamine N-acetyltransferase [Sutcliffiella halmapala]|uniref:UDP-4-amino-4, 6-dideoxy-N-acetyl-beta-L-altrosamine N-acetyltransferase n=1 Tax=Sutcliffiella halmapala TaxID=79882 RepID=UPI0009952F06|nr:UDP-4-amino-4,6-dideoxy-N-acetyl-beta-L-altrosamine N-acetyltransferase [Sutcliffiella halmapala]
MNVFKRAELRDIRENDLEKILQWRNQKSIRKFMYNSNIISMDEHTQWFLKIKNSKIAQSKIFYYNQVPCGILNIIEIDYINNKCKWGFYIGPNNALKGMGTILGFVSLNYIFNELSIRKLSAEVLSINKKSAIFHQKLGFVREGKLRKNIIKDGEYIDVLLYGLLEEEWKEHSEKIKKRIEGRYI